MSPTATAGGRGNADDPEKDPALFPESRVRPWAVDEKAEGQMEDMVDNFEKTLMLISPIKEGMGQSALDRTCRDDDRGDLFFAELAALQAKKEAEAARGSGASRCGSSLSIGEIFESLYRETHGLPPRKKRPPSIRGSISTLDPEVSSDDQDAETEVVAAEESDEDTAAAVAEGADGGLVDDTDVARLLAELQADIDTDGSDWDAGEPGVDDGETPEVATGKTENEQELAETTGGAESRSAEQGGTLQVVGGLESAAAIPPPSCQRDRASQEGDEPPVTTQSGGTRPEEGRPAAADDSRQREAAEEGTLSRATERRVDISRMKIDAAPERGARVGPRPQSAPSACFSSGNFSRMSRTSSSHLARAVSQRVLQATKEAEERTASEAQQQGEMRHRAPGSANTPVRRTSYLRSRQPRAARWAPHEADGWHSRPLSKRGAQAPPGTAWAPARQRPHTATPRRRASAKELDCSTFTPLLSGPEVEFLFGKKADQGATSSTQPPPPPSLRKTTLGRLLRRTASSNTDGSRGLLRETLENGGSPYSRRPTSAETSLLSPGTSGGRGRGGFKPAWDAISVGQKKITPRPSTAATKGGRGRPSSAQERPLTGSTTTAGVPPGGGRKRRTAGSQISGASRTPSKEIAEPKRRDTVVLAANSSARNHLVSGRGDTARVPLEGVKARERGARPAMSLNQALDAALAEAIGTASPLEQFINARKTVAEMKQINTKDSTGDILLSTQGMPKARVKEECWSSESHRQYR